MLPASPPPLPVWVSCKGIPVHPTPFPAVRHTAECNRGIRRNKPGCLQRVFHCQCHYHPIHHLPVLPDRAQIFPICHPSLCRYCRLPPPQILHATLCPPHAPLLPQTASCQLHTHCLQFPAYSGRIRIDYPLQAGFPYRLPLLPAHPLPTTLLPVLSAPLLSPFLPPALFLPGFLPNS